MRLKHKITTLVYLFNAKGELLLLHRTRKPNRGLWSPIGGKLHTEEGESPYQCAVREIREEVGIRVSEKDLHLAGLVAEHGYEGEHHWLMFLFECKKKLKRLPPKHDEGTFEFVPLSKVARLNIPHTDKQILWPLFQKHRGGFFSVKIDCVGGHRLKWKIEEARKR
jgi:8-oxo-dGTP diphosphatase